MGNKFEFVSKVLPMNDYFRHGY